MTQVVMAPDGRRLSVESLGAPGGKPVFLLHGTPGVGRDPRPRGIVLYRLGIRMISYDRPGYPGSDRFVGRTVADAAADVGAIADYFGIDRFSVVGRSGGAPHALACAAVLKHRVVCAATLGSLAPYDAEGLDWCAGMTDFNVQSYRDAEADLGALIATLKERAGENCKNSKGLLEKLWPDLTGHDEATIGDVTLRRIITQVYAEALCDTADGWIDDVIALSRAWGFDLSSISTPVKLWHASNDAPYPISHSYWLNRHIHNSVLEIAARGGAHFGTLESLPKILTWVVENADESSQMKAAALVH